MDAKTVKALLGDAEEHIEFVGMEWLTDILLEDEMDSRVVRDPYAEIEVIHLDLRRFRVYGPIARILGLRPRRCVCGCDAFVKAEAARFFWTTESKVDGAKTYVCAHCERVHDVRFCKIVEVPKKAA